MAAKTEESDLTTLHFSGPPTSVGTGTDGPSHGRVKRIAEPGPGITVGTAAEIVQAFGQSTSTVTSSKCEPPNFHNPMCPLGKAC